MKIKSSKLFKILAIALCFFMVFEQSGFAQIAGQLDISGHLAAFSNSLVQDKFRPLHLRYLQYDPQLNNFKLLLDKGNSKKLSNSFVEESTKTLLQYFLVGVSLPNDAFWVNLRPDSPDNVIDPLLGQTDVGKILLEADVQLKKDTARFTSPETPEGKEYWDKLYEKAGEIFGSQNVTIPTLTRPWIVPNEIILRETSDNAYIYKATLKVMLEDDYLKGSAVYNFDDPRLKELNTYASSVLREKIIPKLTQEVNASKKYAALRQVYYSLILAQWFKQRYQGQRPQGTVLNPYTSLIDRKNLNGLISKGSWSKNTYFQQYQKSFKDGEYNFKVPMSTPYGQVIRSYFSGGIALIGRTLKNAIISIPGKVTNLGERIDVPQLLRDFKNLIILSGDARNVGVELPVAAQGKITPLTGEQDTRETASSKKAREYAENFIEQLGVSGVSFGGARELNNPKARAELINNKIYINSAWIGKMSEDELERVIAHEVQHALTDILRDEKGLKIGGLHEEKTFKALQQRIGNLYDKVAQEQGNVFGKPKNQYQENWELLSLLRGYKVYQDQIARGLNPITQPYEFIEAFRESDLLFLNEDYLFKVTKDFKPAVGQNITITYEDLRGADATAAASVTPATLPSAIVGMEGLQYDSIVTKRKSTLTPGKHTLEEIGFLIDAISGQSRDLKRKAADYALFFDRMLARAGDLERFWDEVEKRPEDIKNAIYRVVAAEIFGVDSDAMLSGLNNEVGEIAIANFYQQIEEAVNSRLNEVKKQVGRPRRVLLKWLSDPAYRRVYTLEMQFYNILHNHRDGQPWRTLSELKSAYIDVDSKKLGLYALEVVDGLSLTQLAHINRSQFFRDELKESLAKHRSSLIANIREKLKGNPEEKQVIRLAVIGAAFGQEAISLAAELNRLFNEMQIDPGKVDFEIHVFDLANPAYEKVKDNTLIFPTDTIYSAAFTQKEKNTYFKSKGNGLVRSDFLNDRMRFHDFNLLDPSAYSNLTLPQGGFDFVTLHNVLQYLVPGMLPGHNSLDAAVNIEAFETVIKQAVDFVGSLAGETGIISVITNGRVDPLVSQAFNNLMNKVAPQKTETPAAAKKTALQSATKGSEPATQNNSPQVSGEDLRSRAEQALERPISDEQFDAIQAAHEVGEGHYLGTRNEDGTYNKNEDKEKAYTPQEIAQKVRILEAAGFTREEREKLIKFGIAGNTDKSAGGAGENNRVKIVPVITSFRKGLAASLAAFTVSMTKTLRGLKGTENVTLVEYLSRVIEVTTADLVALQTHTGNELTTSGRFSGNSINKINDLVEYWKHTISNFISRQFADYQRGIVELVSNGLDASRGRVNVKIRQGSFSIEGNIVPGEVTIANSGGVSLPTVFASFLIPTYSTKELTKIVNELIGRFGVGFLSAFNYIDSPTDALEIVSFDKSTNSWFRINFGVRIEGQGKSARKVIVVNSIKENVSLGEKEKEELFSGVGGIAEEDGGTAVRIVSKRLADEAEIGKINKALSEYFDYWTGTPISVENYQDGGEEYSKKEIGLDQRKYQLLHEERGRNGKKFSVRLEAEKGDGFAYAENPGEGQLAITLQGGLVVKIAVLGSNTCKNMVVNLPASTKIPVARDKIIIDEQTVEGILSVAKNIAGNKDLTIKEKIALLNTLYYFMNWAKTTNPALVKGNDFEDIVKQVISDYKEKALADSQTTIFVPDILLADEFFGSAENVILVNPKLLSQIVFAGKDPTKLLDENKHPELFPLDIFIVPVKGNGGQPALRLGDMVFLREADTTDIDHSDIIWQNILKATAIDYWIYMMEHLGEVNDARFELAGKKFSVVDDNVVKKELILGYIDQEIQKIENAIEAQKSSEGISGLELEKVSGLKDDLKSFKELRSLVEEDPQSGIYFFIFEKQIREQGNDVDRFTRMAKKYARSNFSIPYEIRKIEDYIRQRPPIKTEKASPVVTEPTPADLARLVVGSSLGSAMRVQIPGELSSSQERSNFFAFKVLSIWWAKNENARNFIQNHLKNGELLREIMKAIADYYDAHPDIQGASEIEDNEIGKLLEFLNDVYIRGGEQNTKISEATEVSAIEPKIAGTLTGIITSFFRKGGDISLKDISEEDDAQSLRSRAARGQLQQSVNFQDPEEFIFIRELLQNSKDAILDSGSARDINIETRLVRRKDGTVTAEVVVRDTTGMDIGALINYLLIANRSSKTKDELLTGFFGHGFLTALKESGDVIIKTSDGNGKVIILHIFPVFDAEESVITDVSYKLYEVDNKEGFKGTEVTWQKRGSASLIDEVLLRLKAEMFSRTLEGDEFRISLNGKEVPRLDRDKALLAEFIAGKGSRCNVYLDAGRASQMIQRGLFVTRFDRRFITEVLGITANSDLFNLLIRLADLGVVVELPAEIDLTRDRAHFISRDITESIRYIIVGALFDAAVKAILSGKMDLPYDFSYDFLTEFIVNKQEALISPDDYSNLIDGNLKIENIFGGDNLLGRTIKYLLHSNVNLLNIIKNWPLSSEFKLQEFLSTLRNESLRANEKVKNLIKSFLQSQEFANFVVSPNEKTWEELKGLIEEKFGVKITGPGVVFNISENEDPVDFVKNTLASIVKDFYRGAILEAVSSQLKRGLEFSQHIEKIGFREILEKLQIKKITEDNKTEIITTSSKPSSPAIKEDIIDYLTDKFVASRPINVDDLWQAVKNVKKEPRFSTEFTGKLGEEFKKPNPLKQGVDLTTAEKYKNQIPYLYFFLRASKIIVDAEEAVNPKGLTKTDHAAYYDTDDVAAAARAGNGMVSWHLFHTTTYMKHLLEYLENPTDNKLYEFIPYLYDKLTHEMTHEEERASLINNQNTHTKYFFELQGNRLKDDLTSPDLHDLIKKQLEKLSEEYKDFIKSSSVDVQNAINKFYKSNTSEMSDDINRVINEENAPVSPIATKGSEPATPDNASQISGEDLRSRAEQALERPISDEQFDAIQAAHEVGEGHYLGTRNEDGTYNKNEDKEKAYTPQEIAQKVRILEAAGFTREEREKLIKFGIAGNTDKSAGGAGEAEKQEFSKATNGEEIEKFIKGLEQYISKDQYKKLSDDKEHGFEHGLDIAKRSLDLAEQQEEIQKKMGDSIDYTVLVLGAILHDIYAVVDRKNHDLLGAKQAEKILEKMGYDPNLIKKVCDVVRSHGEEKFSSDSPIEAKIVRDADTIAETVDLERIRDVSIDGYGRVFYNPSLPIKNRKEILSTDDRDKVEAEENDCLQFLLRNVTKGVSPNHYVTESAKEYIIKADLMENNKSTILGFAKEHNPSEVEQIEEIIDEMILWWPSRTSGGEGKFAAQGELQNGIPSIVWSDEEIGLDAKEMIGDKAFIADSIKNLHKDKDFPIEGSKFYVQKIAAGPKSYKEIYLITFTNQDRSKQFNFKVTILKNFVVLGSKIKAWDEYTNNLVELEDTEVTPKLGAKFSNPEKNIYGWSETYTEGQDGFSLITKRDSYAKDLGEIVEAVAKAYYLFNKKAGYITDHHAGNFVFSYDKQSQAYKVTFIDLDQFVKNKGRSDKEIEEDLIDMLTRVWSEPDLLADLFVPSSRNEELIKHIREGFNIAKSAQAESLLNEIENNKALFKQPDEGTDAYEIEPLPKGSETDKIWKVTDRETKETFVLKRTRFFDESKWQQELFDKGVNIPRIYAKNDDFIVMEYFQDSENISDTLKNSPQSVDKLIKLHEIFKIIGESGRAKFIKDLKIIRESGIIHNDVKEFNNLLPVGEQIFFIDFESSISKEEGGSEPGAHEVLVKSLDEWIKGANDYKKQDVQSIEGSDEAIKFAEGLRDELREIGKPSADNYSQTKTSERGFDGPGTPAADGLFNDQILAYLDGLKSDNPAAREGARDNLIAEIQVRRDSNFEECKKLIEELRSQKTKEDSEFNKLIEEIIEQGLGLLSSANGAGNGVEVRRDRDADKAIPKQHDLIRKEIDLFFKELNRNKIESANDHENAVRGLAKGFFSDKEINRLIKKMREAAQKANNNADLVSLNTKIDEAFSRLRKGEFAGDEVHYGNETTYVKKLTDITDENTVDDWINMIKKSFKDKEMKNVFIRLTSGGATNHIIIDENGKRKRVENKEGEINFDKNEGNDEGKKPPVLLSYDQVDILKYNPGRLPDDAGSAASAAGAEGAKTDQGGIDFRAMPITTQPMPLVGAAGITPGTINIANMNLDKEWQAVENMLNAGITPSLERIKEYLIVSCKGPDCQEKINQVLSGIADILRLEEEHSVLTEAGLKEMLTLLESNKSAEQLGAALLKISIMPREPMKI